MPKPIPEKMLKELPKFEQNALIELWEIDLRHIHSSLDPTKKGELLRFHNGLSQGHKNLIWQGNEYQAYPIQAEGFEVSGQGPSNRPSLVISNLYGIVTAIVSEFGQGIGAKVTRHQVYAQFLDAVNFPEGNTKADPLAGTSSYYIVEQLKNLDDEIASFELSLPAETDNARIPLLMITSDVCIWQYRSAQCGYTGEAVADEYDRPTTDLKKDRCSHCIQGCKLRFGNDVALPFGGFPSTTQYGN
ncbi:MULTISPECIES: phage minor tail protein L [Pasteurellaceae]|uniref:Phage minor tail protein L n=3 Tax=Pasteurellaceae TaxID=712 RepID=A0AAW8CK17_9PAST|nr:phage minor tail protein L [Pasteurella atlantica]MBR0574212.1 phage minor tail protein L [Pasteurella atlantica]MDP8039321.1 phage minor tail protein L [Pasteurella atlantica]MDP8041413.1 phage minor tail protein L [Pasteurella atlantica]MDP8043549.1 phage minor tail protein L [Pasteurella atlantica]MDP8045533.1 phage minor tail protein L [Pasteurella atlantica]